MEARASSILKTNKGTTPSAYTEGQEKKTEKATKTQRSSVHSPDQANLDTSFTAVSKKQVQSNML